MDPFTLYKKNILSRKDKSNKGSIDRPVLLLIQKINKQDNYCTTSSCSGRVVILIEPLSGIKKDFNFLFESHSAVTFARVKKALNKLPKQPLWFRFEPMILHVACKNLEDAAKLMATAKPFFKHSGIISAGKRFVLEIRGSEFVEAPVAQDGKLIVGDAYLKTLVREANKKLKITSKKIKYLFSAL